MLTELAGVFGTILGMFGDVVSGLFTGGETPVYSMRSCLTSSWVLPHP